MSTDDEIRMLKDGWRLLGNDVQAELIARGWAVTDLDVADDEPLEFFWPPTAPVGYGGLPEWNNEAMAKRPQMYGPRPCPWLSPTRIARHGEGWKVVFGTAIAQEPDESIELDDEELHRQLERIEWWPMTIDEARQLQMERLMHTTRAAAHDDHSLGYMIRTEPYEGWMREIYERIASGQSITMGQVMAGDRKALRWKGDLRARASLIEAEAWASAVRSARAGGVGWDVSGPTG